MTLCMAWRLNGRVCFASDSRIKVGDDSFVDVGIKVAPLPLRILEPAEEGVPGRRVRFQGELGLCFAGSVLSSLFVKDSLAALLGSLQYVPGHVDISLPSIMEFVLIAYEDISRKLGAYLYEGARTSLIIGGLCPVQSRVRVFLFECDLGNNHSFKEILVEDGDFEFVGSGRAAALGRLPACRDAIGFLKVLQSVASDASVESVGGPIQLGEFFGPKFDVSGVLEFGERVHYWRGGLDINADKFERTGLLPFLPLIDISGRLEENDL